MGDLEIAKGKISFLENFAKNNGFDLKELPNGIQVKNGKISFTYYVGERGSFVIDRYNGFIEKGYGFGKLKDHMNNFVSSITNDLIEISFIEAIQMLRNDERVLYVDRHFGIDNINSIDSSESIDTLLSIDKFYKKNEIIVNGKKFSNKEDALEEINKVFGV